MMKMLHMLIETKGTLNQVYSELFALKKTVSSGTGTGNANKESTNIGNNINKIDDRLKTVEREYVAKKNLDDKIDKMDRK